MTLTPFLDPDRRVFSRDKFQHGALGLAVGLLPAALWPWWVVLLVVLAVGAIFELGQWDAARGTPLAGQVGYGFGLLDLAWDLAGGGVAVALIAVLA